MAAAGSPPRVWGRLLLTTCNGVSMRFTPTRVGTTRILRIEFAPNPVHPHACGDDLSTRMTCPCETGSPPRVWGRHAEYITLIERRRFTPTRVGTTPHPVRTRTARPVHPHACGDDSSALPVFPVWAGSPPRVWGRPSGRVITPALCRFTPTRVGTTSEGVATGPIFTVHPHACGDDSALSRNWMGTYGSPPRVWGRRRLSRPAPRSPRFTPTRVGTTRCHPLFLWGQSVHPHACGDDLHRLEQPHQSIGSPPRVWGRLARERHVELQNRFTPTRVGTTATRPAPPPCPTVHPHACGDDDRPEWTMLSVHGSPPRVWGRPSRWSSPRLGWRFTPTRVGTTATPYMVSSRSPVHPHACGDDAQAQQPTSNPAGSPPRVWGRRRVLLLQVVPVRFTPTRVGTTRIGSESAWCISVHPHACGDDMSSSSGRSPAGGSPPRVWGRRDGGRDEVGDARFTPTRVGTTPRPWPRPEPVAVHPHACGDDDRRCRPGTSRHGSPPRVWGRHPRSQSRTSSGRFTPTRVGTTPTRKAGRSAPSVHPHACGDDRIVPGRPFSASGSPPRVWGRRRRVVPHLHQVRFTPTRVGTTA